MTSPQLALPNIVSLGKAPKSDIKPRGRGVPSHTERIGLVTYDGGQIGRSVAAMFSPLVDDGIAAHATYVVIGDRTTRIASQVFQLTRTPHKNESVELIKVGSMLQGMPNSRRFVRQSGGDTPGVALVDPFSGAKTTFDPNDILRIVEEPWALIDHAGAHGLPIDSIVKFAADRCVDARVAQLPRDLGGTRVILDSESLALGGVGAKKSGIPAEDAGLFLTC